MGNLIEAVHYTKIETPYRRDLLVKISDTLLTLAWFHTWGDKSVQIVMKTLFEKQYTKEVILTWIAPAESNLWKYWACIKDWRRCGQFIWSIQSQGLEETGVN